MSFAFDTHVLPVLREMAADPLANNFPVRRRILELGLADNEARADRLLDYMATDGWIAFRSKTLGSGVYGIIWDIRLTPKALALVGVWPADHEEAVYLLDRLVGALTAEADAMEAAEGDSDDVGRLRSAARSIGSASREVIYEVASRTLAHKLPG